MALTIGAPLQVVIEGSVGNVPVLQVSHWVIGAIGADEVSADHFCEALWNHAKPALRGFAHVSYSTLFQSIRVVDLSTPVSDTGSYSIPLAEQSGTRGAMAGAEQLPPNIPARLKLFVQTRLTRPGSKRLTGLVEGDVTSGGYLNATVLAALTEAGRFYSQEATLGVPSALTICRPVVFREGVPAGGIPPRENPITGFQAGVRVTTQNTRKRLL